MWDGGLPRDEEDLALLAVLIRDKVKIKHCVAALVGGQAGGEVLIALTWLSQPINHHLLHLLIDLEHDETEAPLRLKFQELEFAFITHGHSRRRVRLTRRKVHNSTHHIREHPMNSIGRNKQIERTHHG